MSYPLQMMLVTQGLSLSPLPPGTPVISRSECVSLCYFNDTCYSTVYDELNLVCHPQYLVLTGDEVVIEDADSMYYIKMTKEGCNNGYTWDPRLSLCFKLITTRARWTDAQTQCQQEGGRLVKVDTDAKNKLLNQLMDLSGQLWVGGRHDADYNTFVWTDGSPIQGDYFDDGEPDEDECVAVLADPPLVNRWHDNRCHFLKRFVCEIIMTPQYVC